MSPVQPLGGGRIRCFPRVSGDEPAQKVPRLSINEFSPRERG